MTGKNTLLFDLDGTLTDPGEGITNSVMYALKQYGIEVSDRRELYRFIGPPLIPAFEEFYGFSRAEAERAVEIYREYFHDRGIFENELYPGVKEMLALLVRAGKRLLMATSKPEVFAVKVVEHFGIADFFTVIAGSELDGRRTDKAEVILYALSSCGVSDVSQVLMIGDRKHDILGAKKAGVASVGVLYGYGTGDELQEAGADWFAETVSDLTTLLL